jgi:hypothetical protein
MRGFEKMPPGAYQRTVTEKSVLLFILKMIIFLFSLGFPSIRISLKDPYGIEAFQAAQVILSHEPIRRARFEPAILL